MVDIPQSYATDTTSAKAKQLGSTLCLALAKYLKSTVPELLVLHPRSQVLGRHFVDQEFLQYFVCFH